MIFDLTDGGFIVECVCLKIFRRGVRIFQIGVRYESETLIICGIAKHDTAARAISFQPLQTLFDEPGANPAALMVRRNRNRAKPEPSAICAIDHDR